MIRMAIRTVTLACLASLGIALWACSGPVEGLVGQYEADGPASGSPASPPPRLHLRSDGGGGLAAGSLDEPLRWEVRENRILLHTLRGGIIPLTRAGQGLEGDIPGAGKLTFRKK